MIRATGRTPLATLGAVVFALVTGGCAEERSATDEARAPSEPAEEQPTARPELVEDMRAGMRAERHASDGGGRAWVEEARFERSADLARLMLPLTDVDPFAIETPQGAATVETESWVASQDGSEVRIDQTIYVQRDTQKAIVLGKGGQQIKSVGEAARHELEAMLGQRVHLFLFVKVRRRWLEDPERFQELGLDFPS